MRISGRSPDAHEAQTARRGDVSSALEKIRKQTKLNKSNASSVDKEFNESEHVPGLTSLSWTYSACTELADDPVLWGSGELQGIHEVDVSHNSLETLPSCWGNGFDPRGKRVGSGLPELQRLFCQSNCLRALPSALSPELSCLTAGGNMLRSLPDLSRFTRLRHLDVRSNRLTTLPESVGECTELVALLVSENDLRTLPSSLERCRFLVDLDVAGNRLSELPAWVFSSLSLLRELRCGGNSIGALPEGLGGLVSLNLLDMAHGRTALALPASTVDLQQSCNILLTNTSTSVRMRSAAAPAAQDSLLCQLPPALCQNKIAARQLENYVRACGFGVGTPKHLKIMVLGNENVGKSTLVKGLSKSDGALKKKLQSLRAKIRRDVTFGMDVHNVRLSVADSDDAGTHNSTVGGSRKSELAEDEDVTTSIWDFAGQIEYLPTHQLFLSPDALYLLVFSLKDALSTWNAVLGRRDKEKSIRNCVRMLAQWVDLIATRASGARVILVGTHVDTPLWQNGRGDAAESVRRHISEFVSVTKSRNASVCVRIVNLVFVNAASSDGVPDVIRSCADASWAILQERRMVPLAYVELQKKVSAKSKQLSVPIASLEDFGRLVSEVSEAFTDARLAAGILKEFGWVEYFPSLFDDTVFLDPRWLAKMVACVATLQSGARAKRFKVRDGQVDKSTLEALWSEYDKHVLRQPEISAMLIMAMVAFELIFPLAGENETSSVFVVPSLLPKKPREEDFPRNMVHALTVGPGNQFATFNSNDNQDFVFRVLPAGFFSRFIARLHKRCDKLRAWRTGAVVSIGVGGIVRADLLEESNRIVAAATSASSLRVFGEVLLELRDSVYPHLEVFNRAGVRIGSSRRGDFSETSLDSEERFADLEGQILELQLDDLVFLDDQDIPSDVRLCQARADSPLLPSDARYSVKVGGNLDDEFAFQRRFSKHMNIENVVGIVRGSADGSISHMIMPYFPLSLRRLLEMELEWLGDDSDRWLSKDHVRGFERVLDWCHQIGSALTFLHENDVCHCALSTAAILVQPSFSAELLCLTQFSNSYERPDGAKFSVLDPRGSPGYCPPDPSPADPRCGDVFAFGQVLGAIAGGSEPDPNNIDLRIPFSQAGDVLERLDISAPKADQEMIPLPTPHPRLVGVLGFPEFRALLDVARVCVRTKSTLRPSIADVVTVVDSLRGDPGLETYGKRRFDGLPPPPPAQRQLKPLTIFRGDLSVKTEVQENCLGEGTFAKVWACHVKQRPGFPLAFKEFRYVDATVEIAASIDEELAICESLRRNEHIVTVVARVIGVHDRLCGVLMLRYDCALSDLLSDRKLLVQCEKGAEWFSGHDAMAWTLQLFSGLSFIHRNDVAHCE
jgi:serine/threonine protein kinase/GTPase SAR1 family protein